MHDFTTACTGHLKILVYWASRQIIQMVKFHFIFKKKKLSPPISLQQTLNIGKLSSSLW